MTIKKELSPVQINEILNTLKVRFEKNMHLHTGIDWQNVHQKLVSNSQKMWSLYLMEETGGAPDVVSHDVITGEYIFFDCSVESPIGRRSLCYDKDAWESRKENKPKDNAMDMAEAMGVEIISEEAYRSLQLLGNFDTKTSSWVNTPAKIRKLGGALFCDRRYDSVFLYHNGAESYYAARGFRASLRV
jgi:Protein of unknown function (DUF4256)